jgi:hypothetical protein
MINLAGRASRISGATSTWGERRPSPSRGARGVRRDLAASGTQQGASIGWYLGPAGRFKRKRPAVRWSAALGARFVWSLRSCRNARPLASPAPWWPGRRGTHFWTSGRLVCEAARIEPKSQSRGMRVCGSARGPDRGRPRPPFSWGRLYRALIGISSATSRRSQVSPAHRSDGCYRANQFRLPVMGVRLSDPTGQCCSGELTQVQHFRTFFFRAILRPTINRRRG